MMKIKFTLKSLLFFFFVITANNCFSQAGMWTWVGGDSSINAYGIYGVKGVASPLNKPGARSEGVMWKDSSENFWLFGGLGFDGSRKGYLNDVWKYTPSTAQWTWFNGDDTTNAKGTYGTKAVSSASNMPSARYNFASTYDNKGNLWIFGGLTSKYTGTYVLTNDLWKYDISTNLWTWISGDSTAYSNGLYGVQGVPSLLTRPKARGNSTMWWGDNDSSIYLFSGFFGATNTLGDFWKFNTLTNKWTWLRGDSSIDEHGSYGTKDLSSSYNFPPTKWSAAHGKNNNNFWMFGGSSTGPLNGDLNDIWRYNTLTKKWTWIAGDSVANQNSVYGNFGVSAVQNKLGARSSSSAWTDTSGNIWIFGGDKYIFSKYCFNDLWKYDINSSEWTWIAGDSSINQKGIYGTKMLPAINNKPGARFGGMSILDKSGALWLFGGSFDTTLGRINNYFSDLWKFTHGAILPLHLLTFTANLQDKTIHLQWTSENEQNFSHYDVEKSTNGKDFVQIQNVKCKSQNGGKNEYSYNDPLNEKPETRNLYYRLKMVDKDASFSYSKIVIIRLSDQSSFSIFPNPASISIQLQFDKSINEKVDVQVVDVSGKVILSHQLSVVGGLATLSTSKLEAGSYTINVNFKKGKFSRMFIKK